MIPSAAYLASISATRAGAGMPGKGTPSRAIRSMILVRSSPVTVRVDGPPPSPGKTS